MSYLKENTIKKASNSSCYLFDSEMVQKWLSHGTLKPDFIVNNWSNFAQKVSKEVFHMELQATALSMALTDMFGYFSTLMAINLNKFGNF